MKLPSLELGNSSQSLGNKISLGLLMELATFKFGVGIRRTITTKEKKINEKETGKHQKFPKKIVSSKKMKKKESKGKRKSQRAKKVIEKNHTKTHPVLNLRYQHKKAP